jgi:hypothetical protein
VSDKRPGADEPRNRREATQPLWRDATSGVPITTGKAHKGRLGEHTLGRRNQAPSTVQGLKITYSRNAPEPRGSHRSAFAAPFPRMDTRWAFDAPPAPSGLRTIARTIRFRGRESDLDYSETFVRAMLTSAESLLRPWQRAEQPERQSQFELRLGLATGDAPASPPAPKPWDRIRSRCGPW